MKIPLKIVSVKMLADYANVFLKDAARVVRLLYLKETVSPD
jgi:hypothetical protein